MSLTILLVTLHLLGVGTVIGVVLFSLVLVYLPKLELSTLQLFKRLRNMGSLGAGLAILSGIVMAYRYHIPIRGNYVFDAKLLLVLLDGAIAQQVFKKALDTAFDQKDGQMAIVRLKPWAWLSVLIIIAIVAISVFRAKTH